MTDPLAAGSADASAPTPTRLERAQLALTGLIGVLVLVMAAMAGRSLFGSFDIVIHGGVGNAVFLLAIVAVLLAFATDAPGGIVVGAMALLLLSFVQIGLGYVGRDTAEAAAWHLPNGVLLMGIAAFQFARLLGVSPGARPRGD